MRIHQSHRAFYAGLSYRDLAREISINRGRVDNCRAKREAGTLSWPKSEDYAKRDLSEALAEHDRRMHERSWVNRRE